MKKLFFTLAVVACSLSINAQSTNDYIELTREVLKAEKKAIIIDVMQLTEAESQPFWDLYSQYEAASYTVQNKRIGVIKEYANNYETMTDEKADQLWTSAMDFKMELLKLKQSYYKKFKKILPAAKAAKFFQADNKIETMVDAQLAIEIPLIETK